jgi:hypothetical protein
MWLATRLKTVSNQSTAIGPGFAWFAHQRRKPSWVIQLPHYGAFVFEGTESEAEEMRVHKARWEHEPAHKRPASFSDFTSVSHCWNHKGYARLVTRGMRGRALKRPFVPYFDCNCGGCSRG